jgi:hypothetical protein
MLDLYHGDRLPYSTYAGDIVGFKQMVAGGWPFLMHKASQGSDLRDTKVVDRVADASNVPGMQVGIYHFMDDSPLHTQMANFTSVYMRLTAAVAPSVFIRLCVDNEPSTLGLPVTAASDMLASNMAQFMFGLNGKLPLIYGDASQFWAHNAFLSQCPRWLAKYGPWALNNQWGPGWSAGQWQQFSGGGVNMLGLTIPGMPGIFDMSAFSGSLAEAVATWSK